MSPAKPVPATKYPVRRFFATRSLGAYDLSSDGSEAAFVTNLTGATELFKVPAAGGWPVQLTFDQQNIAQVGYSPDGRWLAFLQDEGGDENFQLFLMARAGGQKDIITLYPQSRHIGFQWSANSRRLYYTANRRNPRVFDIYRYDLSTGRESLVANGPEEGDAYVAAVTDNEKELYLVVCQTNLRYKLFRVDAPRRRLEEVTPGRETNAEFSIHAPQWVQAHKRLWFLTNLDSDVHNIAYLQFPQAKLVQHRAVPGVEIADLAVSRDGKAIAWAENHSGALTGAVEQGGKVKRLTSGLSVMTRLQFARNGRVLGSVRSSPREPHDLFCLDLKTGKTSQATQSRSVAIPDAQLAAPQLIHYASFDRRTISGFLYLPKTGKAPYPTIVWPHGGPEHQEIAEYRPRHQFFTNQGFAVFVPNFRGSTGFGRRFQQLIYRDWGGGHYKDVLWGVRHLIRKRVIDPERLGIYGGSFGGYSTLWALTQDPDLWKAGVAVVAPTNLLTFIESTHPSWRKACLEMIGDPDRDREYLRSRSPIEYVDSIRAPLLILHGANDPRVKRSEADQFVARLQSRGIPVEYKVFEGEGHGWHTLERTFEEMDLALDFLNWHLKKPIVKDRETATI